MNPPSPCPLCASRSEILRLNSSTFCCRCVKGNCVRGPIRAVQGDSVVEWEILCDKISRIEAAIALVAKKRIAALADNDLAQLNELDEIMRLLLPPRVGSTWIT